MEELKAKHCDEKEKIILCTQVSHGAAMLYDITMVHSREAVMNVGRLAPQNTIWVT